MINDSTLTFMLTEHRENNTRNVNKIPCVCLLLGVSWKCADWGTLSGKFILEQICLLLGVSWKCVDLGTLSRKFIVEQISTKKIDFYHPKYGI